MGENSTAAGGSLHRLWPLLWLLFLPNLGVPVSELLHAHPSPLRLVLVLAGAAFFVATYLWAGWQSDLSRVVYPATSHQWLAVQQWGPVLLLAALSIILCMADGSYWLCLVIFTSASAGARFPLAVGVRMIVALAVLAAMLGWLAHSSPADLGSAAFWTVMAGLLTVIIDYQRRTNRELQVAREEIACLAVEAERLRFARDLHDLLGHDLARIALQSEVAEALAPGAVDQAITVMRDVACVARQALHEVRAAVAGYRQPTLASELRGAGELLAAAGIACRCEGERFPLPPVVEATLAWAVREGVTNVVKHSRARTCTIRLTQGGGWAAVEVADDGSGATGDRARSASSMGDGSGLAGLAERAAALGGCCEAVPRSDGGFCLSVTLPVASAQAVDHAGSSAIVEPALSQPVIGSS